MIPTRPLAGVRVLDFSTLLPGPLATQILADAGAEVIKVERPGGGDEMRTYEPRFGADSVNFAQLNRGKRSIAADLKDPEVSAGIKRLIAETHVLVEQFRPGVMDRLGLGYDAVRVINPAIVYCAITGYGQTGPKANVAAHDLNYIGDTGLLGLAAGADGAPPVPPGLIADIGGGSLPAVVNILLALRQAEATGEGCFLDIAMCDNVLAWQYWAVGNGTATGRWPRPGGELVTGGSPRYRVYRTADGRYLAAAPIEQRFWERFCELVGLPEALRDDRHDPGATADTVAAAVAARPAAHWRALFEGEDVCCSIVQTVEEALNDAHFHARGLFEGRVESGAGTMTVVPMPLAPAFRMGDRPGPAPALGEANGLLSDDE